MCSGRLGFYFGVTVILCLFKEIIVDDPCEDSRHETFPGYIGALTEQCQQTYPTVCHHYLAPSWYVLDDLSSIVNHCPSTDCGTNFPAWIQGSYPSAGDGIVNLTACVKVNGDCCKYGVAVRVKNCTDYLVYFLPQLNECPSSYCFDSKLPCHRPTTSTKTPQQSENSSDNRILISSLVVLSVVVVVLFIVIAVLYKKSRSSPLTKTSKLNAINQVPPRYEQIFITHK